MKADKQATRLIVISDLHLGGEAPAMMSQPARLAQFIDALPQRLASDEALELVIAGDFIDFLAIPEYKSWTPDPAEARRKLEHTLSGDFRPVFEALSRHLVREHRLTVLIGNHDIEMTLPAVQEAFIRGLGAEPYQIRFVDDGSAYRIGGVLIEHGNRYDGANENDWDGLRQTRSAHSRGESPPWGFNVSPGSEIVERIVNAIKPDYPFIDLFQPQDKLLAYLLFALEPTLLRKNWRRMGALFKGALRQGGNPLGAQPARTYAVGAGGDDDTRSPALRAELAVVFGDDDYRAFEQPPTDVGAGDWLEVAGLLRRDGLAGLVAQGKRIPTERLRQLRATLRRWNNDSVFDLNGDTEQYGRAAERMIDAKAAEVVIMGHTHLARHHGAADKAWYINTGTWADLVTVPASALEDGDDALERLHVFLRGLCTDTDVRQRRATFADVRLDSGGEVIQARLEAAM